MQQMKNEKHILVLYNTATCNLKCKYCYIDKSPVLVQIDNLLKESYKDTDYYMNFIHELFPEKTQLTEIQIWGGEPTLGLNRVHKLLTLIAAEYTKFNQVMFSTNLTVPGCVNEIVEFLNLLNTFPNKMQLHLQLSLDGPVNINDFNRGSGTTEKFTKNFVELICSLSKYFITNPKVSIDLFFKPTLDIDSILKLQTKETIINYYKFFDSYIDIAHKVHSENYSFYPSIPNTAEPIPVSKEDGIKFANFCKLCREIENENKTNHYFKHYKNITPFTTTKNGKANYFNCGMCGSGKFVVGVLPNDLISMCHVGFTALLEEYKNNNSDLSRTSLDSEFFNAGTIKNDLVIHKSKLAEFENQVNCFYDTKENFQITNIAAEIQILAAVNQIDRKYIDFNKAMEAAASIRNRTAYCVRNNINTSGTKQLIPIGTLRLFLNGALDYMETN